MHLIDLINMVLFNIWANRFRAMLTALGIIVGTATIILVVAVGQGSEAAVNEQYSRLNAGTITVMSARGEGLRLPLTEDDVEAIKENCSSVQEVSLAINTRTDIAYSDVTGTVSLLGAYPEAAVLNNYTMDQGSFITTEDIESRNRVVVIGNEIVQDYFGGDVSQALGAELKINKRAYEVVGVLTRVGDTSSSGGGTDDSVIVPYTVAQRYLVGKNTMPMIVALAADIKNATDAVAEITVTLQDTHNVDAGEEDFMVRDAGSRLVSAQESANTMSLLLIIIAASTLVVGGIGIMNVMFVSVKERTREIGILKAIGAKRNDILLQFLFEAVIISLIGGVIGLILGSIFIPLLVAYMGVRADASVYGIVLGIFFALLTGTFFGFYPALKASELSPLEALRYE